MWAFQNQIWKYLLQQQSLYLSLFRKLRDEYDKLEGALKKLGVDPECVVTEEEDGYNAESDLEDDTEQDCEKEVETFVPAVYSVGGGAAHRPGRLLDRVDEVQPPSTNQGEVLLIS